ncbi:ABC transporter ATP-binding protein [Ochrobactrum sp. XJ1]|nr:ABC transporter ATP-binding protein [Ochrobactrum sp. XJ1]
MSGLSLRALVKRYNQTPIVNDISLDVKEGEFVSLLGPSGCGKTTILRMVAGLLEPTSGEISIGGRDVTRLPTNKRNIGLVFQSYALFPHMTVFENVAFGLRRQNVRGSELSTRVNDALARVRLDKHADRYPRQLSGGQQQRVALARSIAPRPGILLFDEPLSNLDAMLRDEMQIELKRLQRELNMTSLFVTHDQHEAMSLSDRICLLASGDIQQYGTPEEIYFSPANGFVAGFIGSPNKLSGTVARIEGKAGSVALAEGAELKADKVSFLAGKPVSVVIRQEDVVLNPSDTATAGHAVAGRIVLKIFSGASIQYLVNVGGDAELLAKVPSTGPLAGLEVGDEVKLAVDPAKVFVSPHEGAAE